MGSRQAQCLPDGNCLALHSVHSALIVHVTSSMKSSWIQLDGAKLMQHQSSALSARVLIVWTVLGQNKSLIRYETSQLFTLMHPFSGSSCIQLSPQKNKRDPGNWGCHSRERWRAPPGGQPGTRHRGQPVPIGAEQEDLGKSHSRP